MVGISQLQNFTKLDQIPLYLILH